MIVHAIGMSPATPLGIDGFTFADLHQPARLRELYDRFVDQVKADRARAVGAVGAVPRSARIARPRRARQHRRRDGAARQPLRQRAVQRRRRRRRAGRRDPRLRRPVPLQDRLRPPPRPAAAERRRARRGDRRRSRAGRDDPDDSLASGFSQTDQRTIARCALAAYGCSLLDREATDKAARRRARSNR